MWVYIRSEPNIWTVGFHDQKGEWHTDSDHDSKSDAANRVAYLNGTVPLEALRLIAGSDGFKDGTWAGELQAIARAAIAKAEGR